MTTKITVTDLAFIEAVKAAENHIELETAEGITVGILTKANRFALPEGVESPFTQEQLRQWRHEVRENPKGIPLWQILDDLESRG